MFGISEPSTVSFLWPHLDEFHRNGFQVDISPYIETEEVGRKGFWSGFWGREFCRKAPSSATFFEEEKHMSHEKNPGWLGYRGDYTTQLYGDYNNPL